jgi:hypothetical protein
MPPSAASSTISTPLLRRRCSNRVRKSPREAMTEGAHPHWLTLLEFGPLQSQRHQHKKIVAGLHSYRTPTHTAFVGVAIQFVRVTQKTES